MSKKKGRKEERENGKKERKDKNGRKVGRLSRKEVWKSRQEGKERKG